MTNQKETEMNAWKTIAFATAALALAAPVANAKFDSSMPSKALHAKVLKHKHVAPKVKTSSRVLIIVSTASPSAQITSVDDCAISGVDCTNQQLCDIWAVNCDLVTVTPTVDAATEDQTAGS